MQHAISFESSLVHFDEHDFVKLISNPIKRILGYNTIFYRLLTFLNLSTEAS